MSILVKRHRSGQIPKLRESYTTYLYWGLALVFIILTIIGFTLY